MSCATSARAPLSTVQLLRLPWPQFFSFATMCSRHFEHRKVLLFFLFEKKAGRNTGMLPRLTVCRSLCRRLNSKVVCRALCRNDSVLCDTLNCSLQEGPTEPPPAFSCKFVLSKQFLPCSKQFLPRKALLSARRTRKSIGLILVVKKVSVESLFVQAWF